MEHLTFVVADIHGRFDLLELALKEIDLQGGKNIIFTGDYIDRGPQSREVVELLIAGPQDNDCTWSFIKGNHEDMILHCIDGTDIEWWIQHGGDTTIKSYGSNIPAKHLQWFDEMPRLLWDTHRVYVHAGVSESHSLDNQPDQTTQWHRYGKNEDIGYHDKHVVHGHTIGTKFLVNRTNLDAGSFRTGRLTVGVFDDNKEGGPIRTIGISV